MATRFGDPKAIETSDSWAAAERRDGFDNPGTAKQSRMVDYDAELRLHNERLREAYEIGPSDRVLDIGCGSGQTTREAARVAAAGHAHGVDSSAVMIERARHLSREERLGNVTFQHADAEVCRFPNEPFDVAISRFGTMFFTDPKAAFANIGRGLRPSARLVMMVWQDHERNEWSVAIEQALSEPGASVQPFGTWTRHLLFGRSGPRGADTRLRRILQGDVRRSPRAGVLRPGRGRSSRLRHWL